MDLYQPEDQAVTLPANPCLDLRVAPSEADHLRRAAERYGLEAGLIERVVSSDILCFDVDQTLNRGRGTPILEEAAELIFQCILAGKKVAIISGRTFDEFREQGVLDPLLRRLKERNVQREVTVYSGGGGEKVLVRSDGSFEHDIAYTRPFSEWESRKITSAIQELDDRLDLEQGLREKGIKRFVVNYRNFLYQWSPYGKTSADEREYDFEKDRCGGNRYSPPRKTRKQLGDELVAALKAKGLDDVEATVSGKTTVSISRRGINKRQAMLDVLKGGSVTYFGDEVSRRGPKTGNDNIVGEMAVEFAPRLTVVALDDTDGEFPEGVHQVGGFVDGTLKVLHAARDVCEGVERGASREIANAREILNNYDIGRITDVRPLMAGHGIHSPFFVVEAEKGKFVLRHVRTDLFKDPLGAARFEAALVNTLIEQGVPFAPILPRADAGGAFKEDTFISMDPKGTPHLLYRYIEGEVGTYPTMNRARFEAMVLMLAKMHRVAARLKLPYERAYFEPDVLAIKEHAETIDNLKQTVEQKKRDNPAHIFSRGERFVLENASFIQRQLTIVDRNLSAVYERLPKVAIHSDYHPPNVIFSGDTIAGIFDFEHMRVECRLYDLTPMIKMGTEHGRFDLENARELVLAYNKENPLRPEEIVALPEIFRAKLLNRICRLVNAERHYESLGFDFNGVGDEEKSLALIDHNDKLFLWYQNLMMALRDLDARIRYGDFRRQIQDVLHQGKMTAHAMRDEYLREVKHRGDVQTIPIHKLESFDLTEMLGRARAMTDVFREDKGCWTRDGNFYLNGRTADRSWCRLKSGDKVLFYTDKVVAYQAPHGNIYVSIRGDDLEEVGQNEEKALIEIALDEQSRVKGVQMLHVSGRDLSRSSVAIQLTDSGIFDQFPQLHNLLKYQLVWQDVDGGLRHRELFDSYPIHLDLLNSARARPEEVTGETLSNIVEFRYFKTSAVRRKALDVISLLYDGGRISSADYALYASEFIDQDLAEDRRVIERSLKNNRDFVRDMFRNLFGIDNVSIEDLKNISLAYCDQGPSKSLYRATFEMADGTKQCAALILMRHDPINASGLHEDQINRSIAVWKQLSEAKIPGVVTFGSQAWELDYRDKDVILGGSGKREIREKFVNNIHVSSCEFLTGVSLADILADAQASPTVKQLALDACRTLCTQVFVETEDRFGSGYFMENPEPRKFMLTQADGKFQAAYFTDTYRVVDFPSLEALLMSFDKNTGYRAGLEPRPAAELS